jgi:hypothetical protein
LLSNRHPASDRAVSVHPTSAVVKISLASMMLYAAHVAVHMQVPGALSMHVAAQFVLEMSDLLAPLVEVPAVHILQCGFPCKQEAVSILGALAAAMQEAQLFREDLRVPNAIESA